MESRWYYILDKNQKKGPFSLQELSEKIITHNTKVWYSGLSNWQKASSLPELQAILDKLPPSSNHKRNIFITGTVAFIAITMCLAWSQNVFSFSGKNNETTSKETSLNNQQLYNLYAPGIVLIQHKYIYEITAGSKKFYFNDYWYNESICYLSGLTENRTEAEAAATPIQGTGFFVTNDGKILTNSHIVFDDPGKIDQQYIRDAFFSSISSSNEEKSRLDSLLSNKARYDTTLTKLLEDSTYNSIQIAEVKEKLVEIQNILDQDEDDGENLGNIEVDEAALELVKNNEINVRKITLEMGIFIANTKDLSKEGIPCNIIASSNDQNVDLALIQTVNHKMPDVHIKLPEFSRLYSNNPDSIQPKMSDRLILIGFNKGIALSATTDGIKSQLTEGKVSQTTDNYKLMYTIPALEGSSGSPVFDDKGRLVSVNFAGVNQTQCFNYGVHPKRIQEFLKKYHVI